MRSRQRLVQCASAVRLGTIAKLVHISTGATIKLQLTRSKEIADHNPTAGASDLSNHRVESGSQTRTGRVIARPGTPGLVDEDLCYRVRPMLV